MFSDEVCQAVEFARGNIAPATAIRRKRGPSLSRRTGQRGSVFQHCKPWNPRHQLTGAFGLMCREERQRKTISLGVCRTHSIAKQKLREHIESTGINSKEAFTTNTAPATTFRAQAEKWIDHFQQRRRKPVKPATIWGWDTHLTNGFCRILATSRFLMWQMPR